LKNSDYCPEKIVEVFPVTDSLRADWRLCDDSCRSDDDWIVLAEFASEQVHAENTEITPKNVVYQPRHFSHNVTLLFF